MRLDAYEQRRAEWLQRAARHPSVLPQRFSGSIEVFSPPMPFSDDLDQALLPPPGTMLARKIARHLPVAPAERHALDGLLGRSIRHLSHRTLLIEEGSTPTEIHVLLDGWAGRFTTLSSGKRQIVALYLPGDVCDFDVFTMTTIDQSIAAIGPVRVAAINRQTLNELSRSQPRLSQGLWWESMVAAKIQRAWTLNIGSRPTRLRLAHLLCELHARCADVGLVDDANRFLLPLTQADLGSACAMTAIHTNRALQELRRGRLIESNGRAITIVDPAALRAAAGFDPSYLI